MYEHKSKESFQNLWKIKNISIFLIRFETLGVIFSHEVDRIIQKFTIGHYHANFAHFQIALLSREGARRGTFLSVANARWLETS